MAVIPGLGHKSNINSSISHGLESKGLDVYAGQPS